MAFGLLGRDFYRSLDEAGRLRDAREISSKFKVQSSKVESGFQPGCQLSVVSCQLFVSGDPPPRLKGRKPAHENN